MATPVLLDCWHINVCVSIKNGVCRAHPFDYVVDHPIQLRCCTVCGGLHFSWSISPARFAICLLCYFHFQYVEARNLSDLTCVAGLTEGRGADSSYSTLPRPLRPLPCNSVPCTGQAATGAECLVQSWPLVGGGDGMVGLSMACGYLWNAWWHGMAPFIRSPPSPQSPDALASLSSKSHTHLFGGLAQWHGMCGITWCGMVWVWLVPESCRLSHNGHKYWSGLN